MRPDTYELKIEVIGKQYIVTEQWYNSGQPTNIQDNKKILNSQKELLAYLN